MGSDAPEGQDNERPRRRVATGAYSIGETPVTNGEFDAFVGGGGYRGRFAPAGAEGSHRARDQGRSAGRVGERSKRRRQ